MAPTASPFKSDGDVLRLRSPKGNLYEIPLREQRTYLGIRISYHSQSRHSVTYRLQAANQAWQRLNGIICSTRHLEQQHRCNSIFSVVSKGDWRRAFLRNGVLDAQQQISDRLRAELGVHAGCGHVHLSIALESRRTLLCTVAAEIPAGFGTGRVQLPGVRFVQRCSCPASRAPCAPCYIPAEEDVQN